MAFLGSFLFLTGFFLLIEFIDRTLRDSVRTRKLTGCPVLSDFPNNTRLTPYSKTYENISTRNLSNGVFRFFTQKEDGTLYTQPAQRTRKRR